MKLIKEQLYWVTYKSSYKTTTVGIIADTIENAISIVNTLLLSDEHIERINISENRIYRGSTKTITVEV